MTADRWRRANRIFEEILDLPDDGRRQALDDACRGDSELRRAVEQRLWADAAAEEEQFMARPLVPLPTLGPDESPTSPQATPSTPPRRDRDRSPLPEHLGPYRLREKIGQGGMGTVFAAERDDDAFRRKVAIKIISSGLENEDIVRRMHTERRILALLEHPNIARIYDAGTTEEGHPYFVMEHVEGVPIDVYCQRQGATIDERVALIRKVCDAVDYANRNLVIHRDLKPSNILVTADGEPKLLDFGVAKLLEPDAIGAEDSTAPWRQRLTLNYASPEQIRGRGISTASDAYALGVLLYLLLTGSLPRSFEGLSPWEAEQQLTGSEPPRPSTAAVDGRGADSRPPGNPSQLCRQLQGDLDSIVLKALRGDAEARYPSAALLADDLDRYLGGFPVKAHRGSWRYHTSKWLRRNRLAASLAATALLLAGAFVTSLVISSQNLARSQERIEVERDKLEEVLGIFLGIFSEAGPYIAEGKEVTILEAVDRQTARIESDLENRPRIRATVLATLGWIYLDLGQHSKAHDFHQRALTLLQGLDGESLDVAESLDGVAASLREQMQLDRAEEISAQSLDLFRRLPAAPPESVLRALNNRVNIFCYREDWQTADPLSAHALEASRNLPDQRHPEAAKAVIQRAVVERNLGNDVAARQLYQEVEATYRQRFTSTHPLLATLYNNVGRLEIEAGRLDSATEYLRQADEHYAGSFGDDYYDRVKPLLKLGTVLHQSQHYGEAEAVLRQAIDIARNAPEIQPKNWDYFGRPAVVLAKVMIATDRCSEVLSLLSEEVPQWRAFTPGHDVVVEAQSLLDTCREAS